MEDYLDYKIRLEKIANDLASIGADDILGKNLSKHLELINNNIDYINGFIDKKVPQDSEMYCSIIEMAFLYYRYRDKAIVY